jgi:2-succinyl-6-hydroxy-2,4-cyclohexadiene-1-carboxylate synthase
LNVFLHGFLGNQNDWASVVKSMQTPCLCLDLPGHGEAPFDLEWEKKLLNRPPFHLIGYSMGGRLALQFAQKYPVLSLTLISTHLGLSSDEQRRERKQKEEFWTHQLETLSIDEFIHQWYDQPLFQSLRSKISDIDKMRQKQNKQGLLQAFKAFSLSSQPLHPLPPNTKLIVGELDTAYRAMYAPHPHIVVPNAGHAIHLENPTALAKVLA